ncbi:MAG: hypothetical protein JWR19_1748 [Pedosphaera sp.]|nr:hypothetical protein [Pedosphaera sp.]
MVTNDIAGQRLVKQQIAGAVHRTPGRVVASLGAMQAQDHPGALWSIGLRLAGATEADVQQAVAERSIVRTWPMRGTLHIVAAADVRWMLELLTPRIIAGSASRVKDLELNDAIFARCGKLFVKALQGGKQLTCDEMHAVLERARISTASQRGYHILWRLAQERVICFGAHEGKQATFALLDEWVPQAKSLEREQALAELALRYFTSHGPATVPDYIGWSGLKAAEARAGLAAVSSQLVKETIEGKVYWMSPERTVGREIASTIYLLPGFDEFMLGYKDRSAALDGRHAQKIIPGNNGMFMPTIVKGGRVVGTWKRAFKKNAVVVTPSFFTAARPVEMKALAVAAERYGKFLGMAVVVQAG